MKIILRAMRLTLPILVAFTLIPDVWSTAVAADEKPGRCVIKPNAQSNAESLGIGVVTNAKSVCDASIEGCGACVELCRLFTNINDKFGCPLDGADGFCNPDFPSDPDCDFDKDGFLAVDDCDDNDPFTYPGALEICYDAKDNTCTNGLIDEQDPVCIPDGNCDALKEGFENTDCQPQFGSCPLFNEKVINDIEESLDLLGTARLGNTECAWAKNPADPWRAVFVNIFEFGGPTRWHLQIELSRFLPDGSIARRNSFGSGVILEAEEVACIAAIQSACGSQD